LSLTGAMSVLHDPRGSGRTGDSSGANVSTKVLDFAQFGGAAEKARRESRPARDWWGTEAVPPITRSATLACSIKPFARRLILHCTKTHSPFY